MKQKNFIFCTAIMMTIYLCGTLAYFTQIHILENNYASNVITSFVSGWNYLSQALGMLALIWFCRYKKSSIEKNNILYGFFLLSFLILAISVCTDNAVLRISMIFLTNIIIGFETAFAFSLTTKYVEKKRYGMSFALAYAIGGIGTWVISKTGDFVMDSYFVLLPFGFLTAITLGLIYIFHPQQEQEETNTPTFSEKTYLYLCLMILLMAIFSALGSNDPIIVESGVQIDFLTTRFYYAAGLFLAGWIFDYNPRISCVCSLGALLYSLMVIILYQELPNNSIVIGLTDTFTAFFAVWRAGSFMHLSGKTPSHAGFSSMGLCISRIVEGSMVLLLCKIQPARLSMFLMAGFLFLPLLSIAYLFIREWLRSDKEQQPVDTMEEPEMAPAPVLTKEMRRAKFAETYHLTRREEEIAEYLAEKKTNGEIAALLNLSESTVRFHVSNILKKTSLKNRNEVARSYYQ